MLMKKFSKVIVALVTILVLGLVATGCSCSNSNKNNTNSTDGVVVAPTSTNGGSTADTKASIVGKWKYNDPNANIYYVFMDDGNGSYDFMGQVLDFKYTTTDTELTITFKKDESAPLKAPYTIAGDMLTIKDAAGNDVVYKKVSESREGANQPQPKFKAGDKVTADYCEIYDELYIKSILWWTEEDGWDYDLYGHMVDVGWMDIGCISEQYIHPAQ